MNKANATRSQACRVIVWRTLPVWLLWLGVIAAGCAPTGSATGGGAPLSPTPDLTATAAAAVLEQALADTSATVTAEAIATMTVTALELAIAEMSATSTGGAIAITTVATVKPARTLVTPTPSLTATPSPTAIATPESDAPAPANAHAIETGIAATLTAQPSPTRTPTTTPTPTPTTDATATAHALATVISAQVEATLAARPTATALPTLAPTPTPTFPPPTQPPPTQPLAPVVCTITVAGELSGLWNQAELGCPVDGASIVWSSWTPYERGMMMWRSDTNHVYGFFNSGWWQSVPDVWDGQSPTPSRGAPPPGLLEPIRGTGHIWGTNETFFRELGWARAEQKGFCALVQSFERGFLLRSSTVAACKDNLFNHAQGGNFPLDTLAATQGGGWRAQLR